MLQELTSQQIHLRCLGGWQKWLAMVISVIGYLVAVWPGSVLGLDGTLWN